MNGDEIKVLGFALGNQWFSLELSTVREVVEEPELTIAPMAPECARGVFNYHGNVITVVDPAHFFGVNALERSPDTRIVVLEGDNIALGFQVDRADKIELLPREAILTGKDGVSEKLFVRSVVTMGDRLYNLVDLDPLLEAVEEEFTAANER